MGLNEYFGIGREGIDAGNESERTEARERLGKLIVETSKTISDLGVLSTRDLEEALTKLREADGVDALNEGGVGTKSESEQKTVDKAIVLINESTIIYNDPASTLQKIEMAIANLDMAKKAAQGLIISYDSSKNMNL